jgi:hypothetical protein
MLAALTIVHTAISLVGIGTGFVVAYGLLGSRILNGWTAWFLWTTIATSVTGFFFPFHGVTPGIVVGILSLLVLAIAWMALYRYNWRRTYAVTAVTALYFNVFVLFAQLFNKVPALHQLAPTESEPPFQITQLVVLLIFVGLGIQATRAQKVTATLP